MTQGCCKAQTHALLSVDRSSKSTAQKQMVSTEVAKRGSKEREGIDSLAAIHSQTCDSLKGSEFTYMTKDFCYSKLLRQEAIYLDYKLTVWEGKKKKIPSPHLQKQVKGRQRRYTLFKIVST